MKPASRAIAFVTAAAVGLASVPAHAQNGSNAGIPMIRDAEIEQLLREYTQPILKAAGLRKQNVRVVIINDKSFNAFVMDAHRIFVNAGALMEATTPNQVIGVFSHESGHIVGGHLSKMRQEIANAQTAAIIAMLLGIGAVAAARTRTIPTWPISAARSFPVRRPTSEHLAGLPARPGGIGRPRRRALFDHDRPIGQGHVRHLQALRRRIAVLGALP